MCQNSNQGLIGYSRVSLYQSPARTGRTHLTGDERERASLVRVGSYDHGNYDEFIFRWFFNDLSLLFIQYHSLDWTKNGL